MMLKTCLCAMIASVATLSPAMWADEFDDLIAKVNPPARFKDYKPHWSVRERTYTYQEMEGPMEVLWFLVYDGDICVAGIPTAMFQSGHVYVYDFRPGQGVKEPPMPTERFHIETERGSGVRTDALIPETAGKDTFDIKVDGDKVIILRKYSGTSKYAKWSQNSKVPVKADVKNTAILSVHPQYGYNVDIDYDGWIEQDIKRTMYLEAGPAGRHSIWPDEVSCYRVAISRFGKDGIEGYPTNMGATLQHGNDFTCRDGGIMAFLNDKTGWSTCYTNNSGIESRLGVCAPHTDLDVTLDMSKILKEKKDGMNHWVVRHRMVALPPEVTKYVWDTMTLLHQGQTRMLLRMARLEDFEDQPLDICGRDRGLTINGKYEVSDEAARSGKKSLKFTGSLQNGNPTLCVRPNRKYRVEAWMKSAPAMAEQKSAGEARAFISIAYAKYDMDPTVSEPMLSNVIVPNNEWQKVSLEFDAPKWGPSLRMKLVAENCTVYMDDFAFAEVK